MQCKSVFDFIFQVWDQSSVWESAEPQSGFQQGEEGSREPVRMSPILDETLPDFASTTSKLDG